MTQLDLQNYLSLAAKEAERGFRKKAGGPFGAVIVKGKKVISKAHNTVLRQKDPTRHAEINAIQKSSRKKKTPFFDDYILVTTTEPCPMCFSAIHWGRFKKIIYSTTIQDVKKLGFNELTLSARKMKTAGKSRLKIERLKNDDCINLLKKWKKFSGRKTY